MGIIKKILAKRIRLHPMILNFQWKICHKHIRTGNYNKRTTENFLVTKNQLRYVFISKLFCSSRLSDVTCQRTCQSSDCAEQSVTEVTKNKKKERTDPNEWIRYEG